MQRRPGRAISDALDAIERTAAGYHVNIVTHSALGHPEEFLFPDLADYDNQFIHWTYTSQCGSHVTRVTIEQRK